MATATERKRWVTYLALQDGYGPRAEELKEKGVSYAEIFRAGVRACEEYFKQQEKKGQKCEE